LYLLDEPTTGLHFDDINKLLKVLQKLVALGNTVVVIEHNLDVIKCADWVIDLGPEGGDEGGQLVVCGTPEEVASCERSYTGKHLREFFQRQRPGCVDPNPELPKPKTTRRSKKSSDASQTDPEDTPDLSSDLTPVTPVPKPKARKPKAG